MTPENKRFLLTPSPQNVRQYERFSLNDEDFARFHGRTIERIEPSEYEVFISFTDGSVLLLYGSGLGDCGLAARGID